MYKITKILETLKYNYVSMKYLIKEEIKSDSAVNIPRKIWCILHGFSSSKYNLYDFKNNNYKLYLSDFKRRKTAKINGKYSLVLNDKNIFEKVFSKYNLTAIAYGKIKNGKIYLDNNEKTLEEFHEFIIKKKHLIIKKVEGGGGKGIFRISSNNDYLCINDCSVDEEQLDLFLKNLSESLIMEHLTQAEYSNEIYPHTINSMRIITMMDPVTKEVFIPIAVHKFGSEKTKPADNVWKGGMTALIDLETGRLGKPAYHLEKNNKIEWRTFHPDTEKKIEGTIVPNWTRVKELLIETAQKEDYLQYVGWDVVITDSGIRLIEGNNYSDVNILQIHKPLLSDQRVKHFYNYHGIL